MKNTGGRNGRLSDGEDGSARIAAPTRLLAARKLTASQIQLRKIIGHFQKSLEILALGDSLKITRRQYIEPS